MFKLLVLLVASGIASAAHAADKPGTVKLHSRGDSADGSWRARVKTRTLRGGRQIINEQYLVDGKRVGYSRIDVRADGSRFQTGVDHTGKPFSSATGSLGGVKISMEHHEGGAGFLSVKNPSGLQQNLIKHPGMDDIRMQNRVAPQR